MNLFELQAVLSLNSSGYTQGLDNAEKEGNSFLGKVETLTGKIGRAWTKAKTTVQGIQTVFGPVISIVGDAVNAYGDYEQAVGGVKKLFGGAAKTITDNARKAFQTAGISINDYLDLCIQSGATMLKSVGEDSAAAAELMDLAIIDMADNVNALGTDMAAVQNAYRGFARGNFTMLDNLALGYAGTKEGMEQLLADAEELSGIHYDIGSYADMVKAIHVIQQYRGIAGTSVNEASTTQQGSKAAMEAAKQNFLVTLADSDATQAEKDAAAKEYAETIVAYLKNLLPVVVEVLKTLIPALSEALKEIAKEFGLDIIVDAVEAIKGVIDWIYTAIEAILNHFGYESQRQADARRAQEKAAAMYQQGVKSSWTAMELYGHGLNPDENSLLDIPETMFTEEEAQKAYDAYLATFGADFAEKNGLDWLKVFAGYDPEKQTFDFSKIPVDELDFSGTKFVTGDQLEFPDGTKVDVPGGTLYADNIKDALVNASGAKIYADGTIVIGKEVFSPEGGYSVRNGRLTQNFSDSRGGLVFSWEAQSNAKGLWDVPYDDYVTRLHRDEMVLTASQARQYREGGSGFDPAQLYQVVADAVAEAVGDIQINLDGTAVGNAVAGTVSRAIYNKAMTRR